MARTNFGRRRPAASVAANRSGSQTNSRRRVGQRQPQPSRLHGRDPDKLVAELVAVPSNHSLWEEFAETQIREFQTVWSYVDLNTYGPGSDPRPAGPDQEGVVFVDTTQPGLVEQADGTLRIDSDEQYFPMHGQALLMGYFPTAPDPDVTVTIDGVANGWRVVGLEYDDNSLSTSTALR
jgi:hypothetical protein